jgi:hypothetical protein
MESEAASVGFHEHKLTHRKYPRLQLRTVKELMDGNLNLQRHNRCGGHRRAQAASGSA